MSCLGQNIITISFQFLSDHLYNGSPYAIGPLSICPPDCLVVSATLVYCGQTVG